MKKNLDLQKLKLAVKGKIIVPGDQDYDQVRTIFYGGVDKKPALIIRVANSSDIIEAISFAKTNALELAVRSGGHSVAGYSTTEGGVLIDLRDLKKIEIDEKNKSAWVEIGLTAREVTEALDKKNLVVGFGDTGSVGIGGITLGGGIGFLVRKYGLAIDNLLAAQIVTADGKVRDIDAETEPDLFWAIRGGGGNFGIVTKFKFKLHDIDQVYGGMLILPATPEIISRFMTEAEKAPDELSTIANIMPCPALPFVPEKYHGQIILMSLMMYSGDPKTGEKIIIPFRKLDKPIADMLKPMRYPEIFFPDDSSYHPLAVSQTMFMKSVDKSLAEIILERLNASDASMRVVQLRHLGGAMARVADEATAFAHRQSKIMTNVASFYTGPEDKQKRQDWVNHLAKKMNQGDDGAYIGFLGSEGQSRINDAYPEKTFKRLKQIKKQYDPENIFRLNLNISLN